MKITKLITASLLATLALAACHNDDMPGGNTLPEGAVHITAGIEGVQTRAPQLDADGEGTFAPDDMWGMYTFTGDATSPAYSNQNIAYRADNSNPLKWKDLSETEAVTFSAHYPRITGTMPDIDDPAAYMYMPQAYNNTDDLLHATATASKGETVALTFKHLMHRLVINLTAGDGMEGADLSSALINSVAKDGYTPTMCANVEVNLLTGTVTYGKATGSVMLSNGGGPKADWKVAPQDLTAGAEWLRITVGEDVWYYHVPADLNTAEPGNQTRLESGKRLTLTLTLKKSPDTGNTEVELTGSDISGWDTQPEITDEVVIGGGTSGITTYETLLSALQTGGTSADAPTLITLGADITIPAGGDNDTPPINGSGYFKIDGGNHTMTWGVGSNYILGNLAPDADAVHIELTNIKLVQDMATSFPAITVSNGTITLGKGVALDGPPPVITAYSEKAALELGDGCELSDATSSRYCAAVSNGATLVLNGGKTAAGAYIALECNLYSPVSYPLISVPKALTGDVNLTLNLVGVTSIAGGTGGYQPSQADCNHLIVNPESTVSLYGEPRQNYGDDFELYLDPADNQIKLRLRNFTPPASGTIDMTNMTVAVAQATIRAALAAGHTEIKLTGEFSKIGMGGANGTFAYNTKITKCDLSGVTGWGTPATLPGNAFYVCTALQEVVLPGDVQVIGEYAFSSCAALTTVNLSQVTRINKYAFQACTSLTELTLDNVEAIDLAAFYECTSLETLKLPTCTRFGNYIVTGCKALTRIEAAAAGDFVDINDGISIENYAVFHNRAAHSGANAFNSAKCDLVLNADKKQDGSAVPKVNNSNEWTVLNSYLMQWKSISFAQQP